MAFWDQVNADVLQILGDDGESVEEVLFRSPDHEAYLKCSVARGQDGNAAINSQNRGFFPPEKSNLTVGRKNTFCVRAALLESFGALPELGWSFEFAEEPGVPWDFGRIESHDGGILTVVVTRREAIKRGPGAGQKGFQI